MKNEPIIDSIHEARAQSMRDGYKPVQILMTKGQIKRLQRELKGRGMLLNELLTPIRYMGMEIIPANSRITVGSLDEGTVNLSLVKRLQNEVQEQDKIIKDQGQTIREQVNKIEGLEQQIERQVRYVKKAKADLSMISD